MDSPQNITIKPVTQDKIPALRHIAIQTFEETFMATNTRENLDHYYYRHFNLSTLEKELNDPESDWFFCFLNGYLAGYLKTNIGDAQTELKEPEGFEVERIYVLAEYHGSGAGAALMEHAIKLGREKGKQYLWLGVWEENWRAQSFYRKFGMQEFGDHVFLMGRDPQRDLLWRMEL